MPGRLKQLMLKEYLSALESSDSMFVIKDAGLKVSENDYLRSKLHESGSSMLHVHNRIFTKALESKDIGRIGEAINGPSAVVIGDDVVAAIKAVADFAKEHKQVELQAGYFEGDILDRDELVALSKIPPREVLLCQLMSAMQAPVTGVASVLQNVMQKLVCTLKEVEKQKS